LVNGGINIGTDNGYKTRMAAFREASHDSPWGIFPHKRTGSLPPTYQAGNDLEGQPLASHNTAPQPPTTSDSEAKDMMGARPETGESSAQLRQADMLGRERGTETGPATITQGVMRQRTTGRDESSTSTADNVKEPEKVKKSRTFFKHLTPKEPFTVRNQLSRTLFNSWINVLLVAAPAGIAINYVPQVNRIAVFVVNFIAIVPLAAMLGFATEEIALRTGETIGGLLNATFGYVHAMESVNLQCGHAD
jgi:Ca2+:H+ antiporter